MSVIRDKILFPHRVISRKKITDISTYNMLFGQLLALVLRSQFGKLVKDTKADKHCKDFTAGPQTSKKCPLPLRIIKSIDEKTGKEITVLTNILNLMSQYVTKLYRDRWSIEIFFKTIRQNLRIKKFYGETENAIKAQI